MISKGNNTHLVLHAQFAMENPSFRLHQSKNDSTHSDQENSKSKESVTNVKDLIYEPPNIQLDTDKGSKILLNESSSCYSFHAELIREKISILLQNAKHQVLAAQDLILSLGLDSSKRRWLNSTLGMMERDGYVEIFHLKSDESGLLRCVRYLKSYSVEDSKHNKNNHIKKEINNELVIGEGSVLMDYCLEWQIFRIIALGGSLGVLSAVIYIDFYLFMFIEY